MPSTVTIDDAMTLATTYLTEYLIDKDIATKLSINPSQILKKSRDFGVLRQIIEDEDLLIILSILEATHLSGAIQIQCRLHHYTMLMGMSKQPLLQM
jgi:hypothetical protein